MANERIHDAATSNVLAWSSQSAHMQHEPEDEVTTEVDEPPDESKLYRTQSDFKRTIVRKHSDHPQSLLTQALHQQSDEEDAPLNYVSMPVRRRSMNSNTSFASTADLTSDTGLTSPARTSTPSPPPPVIRLGQLNMDPFDSRPKASNGTMNTIDHDTTPTKRMVNVPVESHSRTDHVVEVLVKKRCISFACGPKPEAKRPAPSPQPSLAQQTADNTTSEKPPQRKTCIKFACPSKPSQSTPPNKPHVRVTAPNVVAPRDSSPATVRKHRSPSSGRSPRSLTPRRRPSKSPIAVRSKKYLGAESADLKGESSRFHEFASGELQEDDWILQKLPSTTQRLTINDTLRKENEIRKLGREAEEEALQEEFEDDEPEQDGEEDPDNEDDDEDDEDEDEIEEELDGIEDDGSGYGSDDDLSDGYNTDNEIGFADSDGDEDDADELELWTHGTAATLQFSGATPVARRSSVVDNRSDSSSSSEAPTSRRRTPSEKTKRIRIRPGTPELPDSTDFVCGTLDEDRPMEDAYMSCIAQKRREKMHLIPQDIDPSFPTSEPEDEEDNADHESEEHVWIHGELEDLHHETERSDRRKKRSNHNSPKRYHSPPPKRHHSPAPKARGRSPRRLFDRHSPRRLMSPPPSGRIVRSPPASPTQKAVRKPIDFHALASRPGLTHTKSLPRPGALFPNRFKGQRSRQAAYTGATGHVRGAIDIVKGLEHKRQRRREKYIQKHCNRARKGQVVEKRPQPGKGAQRMRELGLHMAGKQPQTIHVLSI